MDKLKIVSDAVADFFIGFTDKYNYMDTSMTSKNIINEDRNIHNNYIFQVALTSPSNTRLLDDLKYYGDNGDEECKELAYSLIGLIKKIHSTAKW